MRVLVTGATGVVGSEVLRRLRSLPGLQVGAVSFRGSSSEGVVAWPMGLAEPPAEIGNEWDVVIHAAAETRWNLTVADAERANIASTAALRHVMGPHSHLVHVSTLYVEGLGGRGQSTDLRDYRNAYEWSKAAAERMVVAEYPSVTIVRPSMIIGRRTDGYIVRFTGFYALIKAAMTGLAPLIVGEPDGYLELVPVDDVADQIVERALAPPPSGSQVVAIGRGTAAYSLRESLSIGGKAVNRWRRRHGAGELEYPQLVPTRQWERLFLPLVRTMLSERQRDALDGLSYFIPYLSITTPFRPTVVVDDIAAPLERALLFWAERNPRVALGSPRRWSPSRRISP